MRKRDQRVQKTYPLWLVAIATASVFATAFLAVSWLGERKPTTQRSSPSLLGRQGEWVTRPNGRRVCRLTADLLITHRIDGSFCTDWQEPEPAIGQPVDGWVRRGPGGGYQIMIDGSWRP